MLLEETVVGIVSLAWTMITKPRQRVGRAFEDLVTVSCFNVFVLECSFCTASRDWRRRQTYAMVKSDLSRIARFYLSRLPAWDPFSIPGQGLQQSDPFVLPRTALVNNVCEAIQKFDCVRVASPPGSGKTSLIGLITKRLQSTSSSRVIVVVGAPFERMTDRSPYERRASFFQQLGCTHLSQIRGSTLIIDDGLFIYHSELGLELVKGCPLHFIKLVFFNAFYSEPSKDSVSPFVPANVRISAVTALWQRSHSVFST